MLIRIGTRKSKLALIQTQIVINQIKLHYGNDIEIEVVPIITSGDLICDRPLYEIGGKALFLKEIEIELLANNIDMAVHALKDIPGTLPDGLMISAILKREDVNDTLVSKKFNSIMALPQGSHIGTCSVRRKILLQRNRPDLNIILLRGNVDSRMNKLMSGEIENIILAKAGLKRLGQFNEYCHDISVEELLPAAGQGVIAIETRIDNSPLQRICAIINDTDSWPLAQAERGFVEYLNASCKTPLAAYATYHNSHEIKLSLMMANEEMDNILFRNEIGLISDSAEIGIRAAKYMTNQMKNHSHNQYL
jgi:hydroxymethylbilane synthase